MAKVKISQWDVVAANNTEINSININEGCPPSTINNAIREMMSQVKDLQGGYSGDTIPVAAGGTGATTAGAARTNLGITGTATQDPASVNFTGGSITGLTNLSTGIFSATGATTLSGATTLTGATTLSNATISSGAITTTGTLNVTGSFTVDGTQGNSGQVLTSAGSAATPTWTSIVSFTTGMIILWSGSVGSIPSGWALCNGTNGTPQLTNRFIVGAGSTYSPNNTGGSANATLPAHTHTASSSSNNAHSHVYSKAGGSVGAGGGGGLFPPTALSGVSDANTNTVAAHNHTITVNSSGTSATNANLPPYYALAYIMKL